METIESLFTRDAIKNYFVPRINAQTKAFFNAQEVVLQNYKPEDFIKHISANIQQSLNFDLELSEQNRAIYTSIWNTIISREDTKQKLESVFISEKEKALNKIHEEAEANAEA